MRLHIHFGIHRTGTTSIHKSFMKNSDVLSSLGVCYPELGVGSRHVKIAWQLINKNITGAELVQLIKSEISDDTNLIVLSSEDFAQVRDLDWLSVLNDFFDVSASVFLREQSVWLESWYNQHIKWPWNKRLSSATVEVFLDKVEDFYWIDYGYLLGKISQHIAREKLHVQIMDRESMPSVTKYFFENVLKIDAEIKHVEESNSSLSKVRLDIVRNIDLISCGWRERQSILSVVKKLDIPEDDGSKVILNKKQRKSIASKFKESNKSVALSFFSRDELFKNNYAYKDPAFISNDKVMYKYLPIVVRELSKMNNS